MYKVSGNTLITKGDTPIITPCSVEVDTIGQARNLAKALPNFGVTDIEITISKAVSLEAKPRTPKAPKQGKK